MIRMTRWIVAAGAAAAVLFGAAAGDALAADGYGGLAGRQTGGGSNGVLPFTGVELLLYVVVGVAIVAAGLALRAVARRHDV